MTTLAPAVLLALAVSVVTAWAQGAAPPISSPPEMTTAMSNEERDDYNAHASSECSIKSAAEASPRPSEPRCPAECSCDQLEEPPGTSYTCILRSGKVMITEILNGIIVECFNGTLRPSEVPVGRAGGRAAWADVALQDCALDAEPLAEALRRRGFCDAHTLMLSSPRTPLTTLHVQGLSQLQVLTWLNGNEQGELPLAAIAALPSLRNLTLWGPLALAGPLPALPLHQLELRDVELRNLPPAAFHRLSQLRSLILDATQSNKIGNDILLGLYQLEELTLSHLPTLPEGLLAPTRHLRTLDLSNNRLTFLPRSLLAGLDQLEEVLLKYNTEELTLDAGAFANLTSLKSLNLSESKIASLPDDAFSGCGALTQLDLRGNWLETLPAALLADLAALEELVLSANRLAALPAGLFAAQRNLLRLHLDQNNLEELPGSVFRGLSKLKVLSLSRNKLRSIVNGAFLTMAQVKKLHLGDNISLGEEGRWFSAPNERNLLTRFNYNDIRRTQLVALKELDLSWNDISHIDYASIALLSSYDQVNLNYNKISMVYFGEELSGRAMITLDGNPFTCHCFTTLAMQAALRGGEGGVGRPRFKAPYATCAAPPVLKGTPLRYVKRENLDCEMPVLPCPFSCRCHRTVDFVAADCVSWPPTGPSDLRVLLHLNATRLRLRHVYGSLRFLPSHMKKLDLSGLNLTKVPELPPAIEVNLTDNNLPMVPIMMFKNNNNTVHLARNPLNCNCSHEEDVAALLTKGLGIVLDYDQLTCSDSKPFHSKIGVNLCHERDLVINASIVVVVVILLIMLMVLSRRYRYKCLMWIDQLCCCSPQSDEEENRDKDAFISYAHTDVEWAIKILDFLEGPPHCMKVCHHERDWVIGEFIPTQIDRSVRRSRWTVILLSRHFLASVWGLLEFRVSYIRAHKERKARILVVVLDDVMSDPQMTADMRFYVANNTYLHVDDALFFDKLAYALRPRRVPWWRRATPATPATPAPPAPVDAQLHSALEARAAADGALANPAFVAAPVADILAHPHQHNLDTL